MRMKLTILSGMSEHNQNAAFQVLFHFCLVLYVLYTWQTCQQCAQVCQYYKCCCEFV